MSINFKFYSGFSSSDSIWKDWTYIYSENINSTNPEYIEVSPKAETLVTSNERIDYLVLNLNNSSEDFWYVSKYKVFNKNKQEIYNHITKYNIVNLNWYDVQDYKDILKYGLAIVIAPYSSLSTLVIYGPWIDKKQWWNSFKGLWFMLSVDNTDNVYFFVEENLYNYYFHDVISEFWGSITLTNSKIIRYDFLDWKIEKTASLNAVSINELSNWYKIFSRDWKLKTLGKISKDWVTVQDIYSLFLKIITTKWYGWVDYIFASEWLFFLNWIIASPIAYANSSNYLNFNKFNFIYDLKWGYIRLDKFIYSITKTEKWFDLNVLWTSTVWSPINFSSIISKENWEEVTSMINYKDWVLISYKDKNWTYWIDYFSFKNKEKNEKWYLITKEYIWEGQINLKKAKSLKFFCDKLKDNEYIKIYTSINNWDFEEVKTLTNWDRWKNGFFEVLDFNKEFRKIVFKLELKGGFKLYDFIFLDEKIK